MPRDGDRAWDSDWRPRGLKRARKGRCLWGGASPPTLLRGTWLASQVWQSFVFSLGLGEICLPPRPTPCP